jgi:hypothetical protein
MNDNRLIAPRLCGWCHEPFTPRKADQKFCPRPNRCASQSLGQRLRGIAPEAAIAARKVAHGTHLRERVAETFGALSDRELKIYQHGHRDGYNDAYNQCYAPLKKRRRAA